MTLSKDAVVFAVGHLLSSNHKLSFGGQGASMKITKRARAALSELLDAGYARPCKADTSIVDREYYRGVDKQPSLGGMIVEHDIDIFGNGDDVKWPTFVKVDTPDP